MPAQPLPGSIATASTLAFALVHKYVDGTPLYRLAQAFERAGVTVALETYEQVPVQTLVDTVEAALAWLR